jgi:hypothetical protein
MLALLLCGSIAAPFPVVAATPDWWAARGVLKRDPTTNQLAPANDYAVINQGQLKRFAAAAAMELNVRLPGGIKSDR